jgi:hypothetical protein
VAARAVESARTASERLTRQMLKIGETAAAVEARIDDARKDREEKDAESFSRRVALLIESLNSTAIDVTKILSNEVTDSAWAAYSRATAASSPGGRCGCSTMAKRARSCSIMRPSRSSASR